MRTLLPLFLASMLAGCATEAERAAQAQRDVDHMMQVYGPACERLGYQGDSNQWRDCVLRLDMKNEVQRYPTTTTCFGQHGFFQCTSF